MSVNGLDKAGSTALHWAAHGGHVECLQALLAVPRCEVNVQVNKSGVFILCMDYIPCLYKQIKS